MLLISVHPRMKIRSAVETLIQRARISVGSPVSSRCPADIRPPLEGIPARRLHGSQTVIPVFLQRDQGISRGISPLHLLLHQLCQSVRKTIGAVREKRQPPFPVDIRRFGIQKMDDGLRPLVKWIDHFPVHPSHGCDDTAPESLPAQFLYQAVCQRPCPARNVRFREIHHVQQRRQGDTHVHGAQKLLKSPVFHILQPFQHFPLPEEGELPPLHAGSREIILRVKAARVHGRGIEHERMVLAPEAHGIRPLHIHPVAVIQQDLPHPLRQFPVQLIVMHIAEQAAEQEIRAVHTPADQLQIIQKPFPVPRTLPSQIFSCQNV